MSGMSRGKGELALQTRDTLKLEPKQAVGKGKVEGWDVVYCAG